MYDFLLAEKQKKSGEHFSYTLLGIWVGVCGGGRVGVESHGLYPCKIQFFICHMPLPEMPYPPTHELLLLRSYSLAILPLQDNFDFS